MARINLSVSDELKVQMDALEHINWSKVAADAFARIVQQSRSIDVNNMNDVIERLRAAQAEEAEEYAQFGTDWAKSDATPRELRQLAKADWGEDMIAALDAIADAHVQHTSEPFWHDDDDPDFEPSDAAKEEFARGALSVWDEVKAHL